MSRYGSKAQASSLIRGSSRLNRRSESRHPCPGSSIGQTSTSEVRLDDHEEKVDAPPPAYGKQKSRSLALGLRLECVTQELIVRVFVIIQLVKYEATFHLLKSVAYLYEFKKLESKSARKYLMLMSTLSQKTFLPAQALNNGTILF